MTNKSYLQYILEDLLGNNPAITAKAMFGGYGLYLEGRIFGIIAGEQLFLKADHTNLARFLTRDSQQFTYIKQNKEFNLPYWSAPASALEDPHLLMDFIRESASINLNEK